MGAVFFLWWNSYTTFDQFFGIINAETARKEGKKMREALDMAADGLCIGNHVVLYGPKWLSQSLVISFCKLFKQKYKYKLFNCLAL